MRADLWIARKWINGVVATETLTRFKSDKLIKLIKIKCSKACCSVHVIILPQHVAQKTSS